MVTTQPDSGTTGSVTPDEGGTTFSKWRQLGSGVIRDGEFILLFNNLIID